MIFVLLLLCMYYSWATLAEQRPIGAEAAAQVAAMIQASDNVLVVGNDARGAEAIAILQRLGLDTTLIQILADAPTGSVGVRVDSAGKPAFTIHAGSAWDRIEWTTALETRNVEAVETACAACQTSCLTMRSIGRWRTTTSAGSAGTCFVTGSLKTPFN